MKQLRVLTTLLLLGLILFGCSQTAKMRRMSVDEKMAAGNDFFAREKWRRAIPYFQEVVFERKTAFTNEAQHKLADCYYNMKKWSDARYEYQELIRLFPDYEDISTAYFRVGECWLNESLNFNYTQDETISAIDAFTVFIERFPNDERIPEAEAFIEDANYKLLRKVYTNGYIYWRMKDFSAALLYLDEVREAGMDDEIDCKAIYISARIHLYRKDMDKARTAIAELTQRYPDSKEAKRLAKYL